MHVQVLTFEPPGQHLQTLYGGKPGGKATAYIELQKRVTDNQISTVRP